LPNALSNHALDLSSSNPCRKLRQFCGQIRLGGNLKRFSLLCRRKAALQLRQQG
jgi:hypothetical protein